MAAIYCNAKEGSADAKAIAAAKLAGLATKSVTIAVALPALTVKFVSCKISLIIAGVVFIVALTARQVNVLTGKAVFGCIAVIAVFSVPVPPPSNAATVAVLKVVCFNIACTEAALPCTLPYTVELVARQFKLATFKATTAFIAAASGAVLPPLSISLATSAVTTFMLKFVA